MYQTISEECDNKELAAKALDYYKLALSTGLKTSDDRYTDMACTDVLSMARVLGGLSQIQGIWQNYLRLPENNETWILRRYNKMLYQAFDNVEHGRLDSAIAVHDRQLQLIDTTQYSRLIYFTHVEKAKAHAMQGDYTRAIAALKQSEKIAVDLEMKDCKLEVYGLMSQYYQQMGDHNAREHYYNRYTMLKDTLTNYQQRDGIPWRAQGHGAGDGRGEAASRGDEHRHAHLAGLPAGVAGVALPRVQEERRAVAFQ